MSESQLARAPGLRRQALLCYVAIIYALPRRGKEIQNETPAALVRTAEGD